jgi:hypothetical protein
MVRRLLISKKNEAYKKNKINRVNYLTSAFFSLAFVYPTF